MATTYVLPNSGIPSFSALDNQPGRWRSFITGFGLQAALVVAVTTLTFSAAAPQLIQHSYEHIDLVSPASVQPKPYKPARTVAPPMAKIIVPPKAQLDRIAPAPTVIAVRPDPKPVFADVVKLPTAPAPKFDPPVVDRLAGPKIARAISTDAFSGSSALPTLKNTPARDVQTGGFGDPNGVPSNDKSMGRSNIAKLGSFELPNGGGQGNGSGGTDGVRGTVASAGFGSGIASEGGGRSTGAQGRVQATAFAAAAPTASPEIPKRKLAVEAPTTPVSITSKPSPVYTEEARKMHLEGEVLIQVIFTATGQVRVVRLVRALGHGLDDAAVRAAEGIRFTPAQRAGQSVDSTATLHIVFQLS